MRIFASLSQYKAKSSRGIVRPDGTDRLAWRARSLLTVSPSPQERETPADAPIFLIDDAILVRLHSRSKETHRSDPLCVFASGADGAV